MTSKSKNTPALPERTETQRLMEGQEPYDTPAQAAKYYGPRADDVKTKSFFQEAEDAFGIGEIASIITVLYFVTIAAFNAGYFSKVPDRFIDLFSFTDMLSVNIPILIFITSVYGFFALVWILGADFFRAVGRRIIAWLDSLDFPVPDDRWMPFIVVFFICVVSLVLMLWSAFLEYFERPLFVFEAAPITFLFGLIFVSVWSQFRSYRLRKFAFIFYTILNAVFFAHMLGGVWIQHELRGDNGIQTLQSNSGGCIQRKILRSASNGFLLYSPALKTFEYRDKSDIPSIFSGKACI